MSDFDENWQLTGSSDPATPDIQPHQVFVPAPAAAVPQIQVQATSINYDAERENNLIECGRMISHFAPKVDLYQEYENCRSDIEKYSRFSVAPMVWGIIVSLVGLMFVFSAITSRYEDNILTNAIVASVFILSGSGLILLFVLKKVFGRKKREELYVKLADLSGQLYILYNGFSNCVLPPEYTDPRILFKIQSMIISGSCITISNALNFLVSYGNVYLNITNAKAKFLADTSARFNGTPAFFNAVRYLNLR